MDVKKEELTPTMARLVISETDFAFVNTIRRTIIGELPKMAIEDVIIYENSSILSDEMLSHRLGLLPIEADSRQFTPKAECSCGGEGCANCIITYTLTKEGPCTVYSGDLQAANANYKIADDLVPLVKLKEKQRVTIEAQAELGIGKTHAKWQPVFGVGYKNFPIIDVTGDCDNCGECIKACPRNIIKAGKPVKVDKPELCTLCRMCEEECEANAIRVSYKEDSFIFKFETDGSMLAKDILLIAVDTLEKKIAETEALIAEVSA